MSARMSPAGAPSPGCRQHREGNRASERERAASCSCGWAPRIQPNAEGHQVPQEAAPIAPPGMMLLNNTGHGLTVEPTVLAEMAMLHLVEDSGERASKPLRRW